MKKRYILVALVIIGFVLAAVLLIEANSLARAAEWYFADIPGRLANQTEVAEFGHALTEFDVEAVQVEHVKLLPSPLRPRAVMRLEASGQHQLAEITFALRRGRWQPVDAPVASLKVEAAADTPRLVLDMDGSTLSRPLSAMGRSGELLTVRPGQLEFLEQGWEETAPYLAALDSAGAPLRLLVGMTDLELYQHRGRLAAVIAREPYIPHHVRVNLSTTDYQSIYHSRVKLSCDRQWQLAEPVTGNRIALAPGTIEIVPANQGVVVQIGGEQEQFQHRLHFTSPEGRIELASVSRQGGYVPAYRGRVEVANFAGQLVVVNRVKLEQYLYAVVPSEMPLNFGAEALAVQSVVARTYALGNILGSSWQSTSAHVVDSVMSQVYHNQPEQPAVNASVEATRGLVLVKGEEPAAVRYFSTSCGYTANAHEVWADSDGSFPGTVIDWLLARPQFPGGELTGGEEDFANFIDNPPREAYDAGSPWFRWQVTVNADYLAGVIEENLQLIHRDNPRAVRQVMPDGTVTAVEQMPQEPLGELLDLVAVDRGGGGLLLEVEIVGSKGTWRVRQEFNIRHVLRPHGPPDQPAVLERQGSPLHNFSILPSAFVYWQTRGEPLAQITFRGGGFGHGVGMSQYGVRGLIDAGWPLAEILLHYFPGTELFHLFGE